MLLLELVLPKPFHCFAMLMHDKHVDNVKNFPMVLVAFINFRVCNLCKRDRFVDMSDFCFSMVVFFTNQEASQFSNYNKNCQQPPIAMFWSWPLW